VLGGSDTFEGHSAFLKSDDLGIQFRHDRFSGSPFNMIATVAAPVGVSWIALTRAMRPPTTASRLADRLVYSGTTNASMRSPRPDRPFTRIAFGCDIEGKSGLAARDADFNSRFDDAGAMDQRGVGSRAFCAPPAPTAAADDSFLPLFLRKGAVSNSARPVSAPLRASRPSTSSNGWRGRRPRQARGCRRCADQDHPAVIAEFELAAGKSQVVLKSGARHRPPRSTLACASAATGITRGGIPIDVFYQTACAARGACSCPTPGVAPYRRARVTKRITKLSREIREAIRAEALVWGLMRSGLLRRGSAAQARDDLAEFLRRGYHGEMGWLADKQSRRGDPQVLWSEARTIVVLGLNYGAADEGCGGRRSRHRLGLCPRPRTTTIR